MKKIFTLFFIFFVSLSLYAVPVKPEWRTHRQSDGTLLQVMMCGDEHFHYYKTLDNIPLIQGDNGDFFYADVLGFGLSSTGILAHDPDRRTAKEQAAIPSADEHKQIMQKNIGELRKFAPRYNALQQQGNMRQHKTRALSDGSEKRGLVIMVSFPDRKFSSDTATVVWNNILNQEGYSENGAIGSVHDYFMTQSNGLFNLKFDIVGPVQLSQSCYYYGKNNPMNNNDIDINMDELIVEACKAIDDSVDFSKYDWDGDGKVEQVFFLYAGWGEAVQGANSNLIWPHEYWLSAYYDYPQGYALDGVVIDQYACGCEMEGREDVSMKLSGLGIFCHEFSHCLGLPDFYTYTGVDILGEWDLLAMGSYNNGGWCPPNFTSYEREFCGWQQPQVLEQPVSIENMASLSDGGTTYKIVNNALSTRADEYYLLENRQKKGWDAYIPGHGLLVLHVDYDADAWNNNTVNDLYSHPRMTIIPANNVYQSSRASDFAYPYLTNDSLTDNSFPPAKVFNINSSGKKMGKPITKIREANGIIAFEFMGGDINAGIENLKNDISQWEGQHVDVFSPSGTLLFSSKAFNASGLPQGKAYIIKNKKGKAIKIIK